MSFRDLHYADEPLLLPNAWDVSSALAFYDAGYRAVGTTSFGVAAAAGHPDGGRSSKEPTSRLVSQLRNLPVYVSADVEDGYHDDPDVVAGHISGLGVAGINIEDSTDEKLISPQAHAAKVAAIKKRSPEVFVNARVDTYWLNQDAKVSTTLRRAEAYVEAGADGIFIPGASDPVDLRELTANIPVPVNVLVVPGLSLPSWRIWACVESAPGRCHIALPSTPRSRSRKTFATVCLHLRPAPTRRCKPAWSNSTG
jgi:2-methylisocitrate lyase-like PEP mutase family enzyme